MAGCVIHVFYHAKQLIAFSTRASRLANLFPPEPQSHDVIPVIPGYSRWAGRGWNPQMGKVPLKSFARGGAPLSERVRYAIDCNPIYSAIWNSIYSVRDGLGFCNLKSSSAQLKFEPPSRKCFCSVSGYLVILFFIWQPSFPNQSRTPEIFWSSCRKKKRFHYYVRAYKKKKKEGKQ